MIDSCRTNFSEADYGFMQRALELARGGMYTTSPNPMVGAVIVRDGIVIGEGWHRCYGQGHAEVNAVADVAERAMLRGATIYVTLEPCSHYGKTPPCAKLLVESEFERVVVAAPDPNPKVSGRGFDMLRSAGIRVDVGLCRAEAERLNCKFHTAHTLQRAYITLKWAESADGYLDRRRTTEACHAARISNPVSSLEVMKLRAVNDAIIVGAGTVLADNPSLTVRGFAGRSPMRVVIDRRQRVDAGARVFADDGVGVLYVTTGRRRVDLPAHIDQIVDGAFADDIAAPRLLASLLHCSYNCNSALVEGGAALHESFLASGVVDTIHREVGAVNFGEYGATRAPVVDHKFELTQSLTIAGSRIIEMRASER